MSDKTKPLSSVPTSSAKVGDKIPIVAADGSVSLSAVGTKDGCIPCLIDIPRYIDLINSGYMPSGSEANSIPDYGRGILRYLAAKYPKGGVFLGKAEPGSQGFYMLYIYDISGLTDGLPAYSMGFMFVQGQQTLKYFGTNEGNFWYK